MRTNRYILVIGLVIRSFLVSAQPLTLHYDRPARYFEAALVIGNGSLGATVYGRTDFEQISLNDITLWTGEPDTKVYSPEAWRNLADIRDALNKEDYRLADRLQRKVQGHYSENYQPLGSLIIHYLDDDGVTPSITDYRRSLDISQAIATTMRGAARSTTSPCSKNFPTVTRLHWCPTSMATWRRSSRTSA